MTPFGQVHAGTIFKYNSLIFFKYGGGYALQLTPPRIDVSFADHVEVDVLKTPDEIVKEYGITMGHFKKYRKTKIAEMRPVTEQLLESDYPFHLVSISGTDKLHGSPKPGDMISRNPDNHDDKWLVAKEFFQENYEIVEEYE